MARTQSPDYDLRRAHIVENAATLFATCSFRGTSVAEIADSAGVSKSLIYHYFPSKEMLLWEVMCSHIEDLLAQTDEAVADDRRPAAERLRSLLHNFTRAYAGAAARQKVLLNELQNLPQEQQAEIVAKQRRIVDHVQALLVLIEPALGQSANRARVKTMLLFGMINWMHTWYDPTGPVSPDEVADLVLELAQAS